MNENVPLLNGVFYHVFNRGNNGSQIFNDKKDYLHFLGLYEKYISLVAETFAWVLMGNHFHFLIFVRREEEIGFLRPPEYSVKDQSCSVILPADNRWKVVRINDIHNLDSEAKLRKPIPFRMFAHLFNSYSRYYNVKYQRIGSLFEKNFHRIPIYSPKYFKNLTTYIHHNPVHHGFVDNYKDYPWSSYNSVLSSDIGILRREKVLEWFGNKDNFIRFHNNEIDFSNIAHLIIE